MYLRHHGLQLKNSDSQYLRPEWSLRTKKSFSLTTGLYHVTSLHPKTVYSSPEMFFCSVMHLAWRQAPHHIGVSYANQWSSGQIKEEDSYSPSTLCHGTPNGSGRCRKKCTQVHVTPQSNAATIKPRTNSSSADTHLNLHIFSRLECSNGLLWRNIPAFTALRTGSSFLHLTSKVEAHSK